MIFKRFVTFVFVRLACVFFFVLPHVAISALQLVFEDYDIVVLGELHGTNEIPQKVLDIVESLNAKNKGVRLLVEMPVSEQAHLESLLVVPQVKLIDIRSGRFWTRTVQDGRSSLAMLALLRKVAAHPANTIVAIAPDQSVYEQNPGKSKSELIWLAAKENSSPLDISVVLVGSRHVRSIQKILNEAVSVDEFSKDTTLKTRPLSHVKVATFIVQHDGGTAWLCYPGKVQTFDCGEKPRTPENANSTLPLHISSKNGNASFGYFYVGAISASPPFKSVLRE